MPDAPAPETLGPARNRLTLLLLEGAVDVARRAGAAYAEGDVRLGDALVERVVGILSQLDRSLDSSAGALSGHLAAIYEYLLRRLRTTGSEAIDEVVGDLRELAEAWARVVREGRQPTAHVGA